MLGRGDGGPAPCFDPGDQRPGAVIRLPDTSTAEEFVGFYIDHGPARIVDDRLEILPLPSNTRGPLEVQLISYRLGRGVSGFSSIKFDVTK